jgi:DNA-binding NarL/FixJ family response regulator
MMSRAAQKAALPQDDLTADDLVRESKAARVRQLMADGLSLSDIAREAGLSEAETRELMDEARSV